NSAMMSSRHSCKPRSLPAINGREGKRAKEQCCDADGAPFDICGKVIVAVNSAELPRLMNILERGQQNGVRCELIGPERLKELEPHAAGVKAIHVPEAGIVNFRAACRQLAELVTSRGGEVNCSARVVQIHDGSTEFAF